MALTWCFDDETSAGAESVLRRLLLEGAMAPGHWTLEVGNGLLAGHRRGRIDKAKLKATESLLADLRVDVIAVDIAGTIQALHLAQQHDLTVYDAAYLHLAMTRGLGLATIDRELAIACRKERVRVISS